MNFLQSGLQFWQSFKNFVKSTHFFVRLNFLMFEQAMIFQEKLCQFDGSCIEIWFDEKIVNFSCKHTLHVTFTSIWKEFFNWITHMSSNETHMLPDSRANTFLFEMYSNTFQRHLHTYSCISKYSFVVVFLNVNYIPFVL